MCQTVLAYSALFHDDRNRGKTAHGTDDGDGTDRGDYGNVDSNAKDVCRASEDVHNIRGNVRDVYRIHDNQATSGSCGSLERIYHSYTYWQEPCDNLGTLRCLYYVVQDDRNQETQLSETSSALHRSKVYKTMY